MVFCPKCGKRMEMFDGTWFRCQCGVAGQVDSLEWLRRVLSFVKQILIVPRPDMREVL